MTKIRAGGETILLLSGGIDSMVCCHLFLKRQQSVKPLFVDFGQAALAQEQLAARAVCAEFSIPLEIIHADFGFGFGAGEIVGRNAFLISCGLMLASLESTDSVAIGVHAGTAYYDCSPAFIESMNRLVREYTDGRVSVLAPLLTWHKGEIYRFAMETKLPVNQTYSCERGSKPPCGECQSCLDRLQLPS